MEMADRVNRREVRIRVTTRCNYKCFFCHDEGGADLCLHASFDEIRPLLEMLVAEGRRDFTLTGGEPLLNKPAVLEALRWFAGRVEETKVTLLTNGSRLDGETVEALAACPGARVNLSLHAVDPGAYRQITGQDGVTPETLEPILKRLTALGVGLKLNAAMLRNLTSGDSQIGLLVAYARKVGASHVKLIELLLTRGEGDPNAAWFVPMDGVEARALESFQAERVEASLRTRVYRLKDGGPLLEFTRCACRLGCANCDRAGADSFTGGSFYRPCFLSGKTLTVSPFTLKRGLNAGRLMIRQMTSQYGTRSPASA